LMHRLLASHLFLSLSLQRESGGNSFLPFKEYIVVVAPSWDHSSRWGIISVSLSRSSSFILSLFLCVLCYEAIKSGFCFDSSINEKDRSLLLSFPIEYRKEEPSPLELQPFVGVPAEPLLTHFYHRVTKDWIEIEKILCVWKSKRLSVTLREWHHLPLFWTRHYPW
jgi:hypothetical protein